MNGELLLKLNAKVQSDYLITRASKNCI